MKLLSVFILLAMATASANSYSQQTKFNFQLNDATVRTVFEQIESNSEFILLYDEKTVDVNRTVNIKVSDETIESILGQLFKETNNSYKIFDRQIVILGPDNSAIPSILGSRISQSKEREIMGFVKGNDGRAIPGATVVIKGTTLGTITDSDGKYSLKIPNDAEILVFSFVGMKTQEISVAGKSVIDVIMEEDAIGIEEIVAIGYGTQKKINLTGSVANLTSDELVKVPVRNTAQTLAGKLPGLVVVENTAKPGSAPSISIRGFGAPLVIVDGVEQDNWHNIDPNEIESYSILKDAAAAIYGSKAGNGVILITTKRGKIGKPTIEYNSSYTAQTLTNLPSWISTSDYVIANMEMSAYEEELAARKGTTYNYRPYRAIAGLPNPNGPFTAADIELAKKLPNTDMHDIVLKKWSPLKQHNINVRGATDVVSYFLSAGTTYNNGFYKSGDNNENRYNVRGNIDAKISKNLLVGLDLSLRNTITRDVAPAEERDDEWILWHAFLTQLPWIPASYPDPTKVPFNGWGANSLLNLTDADKVGTDITRKDYVTGALKVKYDLPFAKGLSVSGKINYIKNNTNRKYFNKTYSVWEYDEANDLYYNEQVKYPDGRLLDRRYEQLTLTYQAQLDYEKIFGNHLLKGLFVYEAIDLSNSYLQGTSKGFLSSEIDQIFAGGKDTQNLTGGAYEEGTISYVGRLNYSYKNKYLLEGTLRVDGSSRFHKDVRWGYFPSVSAAWRISEENFMLDNNSLSFIDNLKIRASYSQTGFDRNAEAYQYLTTYGYSGQYVRDNAVQSTLVPGGLTNAKLTWETSTIYNGGIDALMFNGKLGLEFDYFYRLREGILASRITTLPSTFGASLPQENLNSIDYRGFELVLSHRNQINDFKYEISGNFTLTRAKYKHYEEPVRTDPDDDRIKSRSGRWVNVTWGYETDGMLTDEDLVWTPESGINYDNSGVPNSTQVRGMIKIVDQNGDRVIDWKDQVEIGKGDEPEVMYGINSNASFKGFDFAMLWQGAAGFTVTLYDRNRLPVGSMNGGWNIAQNVFDNRWTPENPDSQFPRLGPSSAVKKNTDNFVINGRFIRLKSLSLGYTIPKNIISRIKGLSSVRAYIAGYNLLTISELNKFEVDPENPGRYDARLTPNARTISIGINVTLQ